MASGLKGNYHEYKPIEQRRLENIQRNRELLASLQVKEAVRELRAGVEDAKENIQIPGDAKPLVS